MFSPLFNQVPPLHLCLPGHARHHESGLERGGPHVGQARADLQRRLDRHLPHPQHRRHPDSAEIVLIIFYELILFLSPIRSMQ